MEKILWPTGEADKLTPAYDANVRITIDNRMTVVHPAELGGNMILRITAIRPGLKTGALLLYKQRFVTGSEIVSFGGFISGPEIRGAGAADADLDFLQLFMLDDREFFPIAPVIKY